MHKPIWRQRNNESQARTSNMSRPAQVNSEESLGYEQLGSLNLNKLNYTDF